MLAVHDRERRGAIVIGVVLILFGALTLLGNALSYDVVAVGWPLFVVAAGVLLFAMAVGVGGAAGVGFAIPAGIVTMAGLVLAVQNATGLWGTWAYAWALVAPGGVGLGMLSYGLLAGMRDIARAGTVPLLIGIGLFLGFGFFFEGLLRLDADRIAGFDTVFAVGFVVLGIVVIAAGLIGRGTRTPTRQETDVTR